MNDLYESTRNKSITIDPSNAVLKGLSDDGGLFVLRDLADRKIDLDKILGMDYYGIAKEVIKHFVFDFTDEEVDRCVEQAYRGKFSDPEITPLVKTSDGYVMELFNGPTSAFKDVGLSMLPQLISTALKKTGAKQDILILTATSGDTGKAALAGFKDVERTKIIVFYPYKGVSAVQERQMRTQEGKNLKVVAIKGNFDDAQSGVKEIFVDDDFKKEMAEHNITLSSANSINIGRLIPQMVYYFYAYRTLVKDGAVKRGEKVNYVVPTGNFGDILAGYYAKMVGLPVNKLVCASNNNNVLYDFLKTGTYDRNRHFLKTLSPSMDILISSNLERLLYYISGCDNEYINGLMNQLKETGVYKVTPEILKKLQDEFDYGYATDEDTHKAIKTVWEKDRYLIDPHTAVAYSTLLKNKDNEHVNVVLSTASPYKFTNSVYSSFHEDCDVDEFELMRRLNKETGVKIPSNLENLDKKPLLHSDVIEKAAMKEYVLKKAQEI